MEGLVAVGLDHPQRRTRDALDALAREALGHERIHVDAPGVAPGVRR
jgi:hypothetical protein